MMIFAPDLTAAVASVGPWILHAGEYDDRVILGVIYGGSVDAVRAARRMSRDRSTGDYSPDMIAVTATRAHNIDPVAPGDARPGDIIDGDQMDYLPVGSAVVHIDESGVRGDDGHALLCAPDGWKSPVPNHKGKMTKFTADPDALFRVLFVGSDA